MDQKINSGIFQLNLLLRQINFKMLSIDFKNLTQIIKTNPQEILKQTNELQQEVNLFFNRFQSYMKAIKNEINKVRLGKDIESIEQNQNIIEIDISNTKIQKMKIKQQKKIIRKPVFQDNFQDLFCISAEFISFSNQKIKVNRYEKICQSVFDSYSILSAKIPNMINNRELFEKILFITWKLIQPQGQKTVIYPDCQKVLGFPKLFPFNYSKKGSLMKKLKADQEQQFIQKKEGLFTNDRLEKEFEKILQKIQEHSLNLFEQIQQQKTTLLNNENQQEYTHFQIQNSAKNMILKKISLYKINYLSSILIEFIQNQKKSEIDINRYINLSSIERPLIENYIDRWIRTLYQIIH